MGKSYVYTVYLGIHDVQKIEDDNLGSGVKINASKFIQVIFN